MKVLSLFDGISCGYVALQRAGVPVERYYASEINADAIKISLSNFPSIIQLGNVEKWKEWSIDWDAIDLIIGGSPCQGFSTSGKGLNFNDPRSKLFFVYAEILDFIKSKNPNIRFLLENVKMKTEWEKVITDRLGVAPIEINSSLLSAQNRVRLYWSNIPNITQPKDKGIKLVDILETPDEQLNKATIIGRRLDKNGHRQDHDKSVKITQCLEVRASNTDKSNCLTTVEKDNVLTPLPPGRYANAFSGNYPFRYYTITEYCRLQTLPDDYTAAISEYKGKKAIGNAWTVDIIAHIFSGLKEAGL